MGALVVDPVASEARDPARKRQEARGRRAQKWTTAGYVWRRTVQQRALWINGFVTPHLMIKANASACPAYSR
jgi:hypothetical protein